MFLSTGTQTLDTAMAYVGKQCQPQKIPALVFTMLHLTYWSLGTLAVAEKTVSIIPPARACLAAFSLCILDGPDTEQTGTEFLIRAPILLIKRVVGGVIWAAAFLKSPLEAYQAYQSPFPVRPNSFFVEESKLLIKGIVKTATFVVFGRCLQAAASRGGYFYAVPLAAFCLSPQMTCEVGTFQLFAYAVKNCKTSFVFHNKVKDQLIRLTEQGIKKAADIPLDIRNKIRSNSAAMVPFFDRFVGAMNLVPIGFAGGYGLRKLSSRRPAWKRVQDLTEHYLFEAPSNKIADTFAPTVAWAFGHRLFSI